MKILSCDQFRMVSGNTTVSELLAQLKKEGLGFATTSEVSCDSLRILYSYEDLGAAGITHLVAKPIRGLKDDDVVLSGTIVAVRPI